MEDYLLSGLWLEPGEQRIPIIVINNYTSNRSTQLCCVFPRGLTAQPYLQQLILPTVEGFNPEIGTFWETGYPDSVDRNGQLALRIETIGVGTFQQYFTWNGMEWINGHKPYFVIAAAFKTYREAEKYVAHHSISSINSVTLFDRIGIHIRRSDYYPKLGKGYFIVVLNRCGTQTEANYKIAEWRKKAAEWRKKPDDSGGSAAEWRKTADKWGTLVTNAIRSKAFSSR